MLGNFDIDPYRLTFIKQTACMSLVRRTNTQDLNETLQQLQGKFRRIWLRKVCFYRSLWGAQWPLGNLMTVKLDCIYRPAAAFLFYLYCLFWSWREQCKVGKIAIKCSISGSFPLCGTCTEGRKCDRNIFRNSPHLALLSQTLVISTYKTNVWCIIKQQQ